MLIKLTRVSFQLLPLLAYSGTVVFSRVAAVEVLSVPLTVPLRVEAPPDSLTPDEPEPEGASLSTCPAASKFVDVCIDSAMEISTTGGWVPPDPHGAAGPNSLIAVTNVAIECLRKNGTSVFGPTGLEIMFAPLKPKGLFDPKVRYDVHQGRFVVVALDSDSSSYSNIMVAASTTSDPTTTNADEWYFLKINSFINGNWADYPGIAVDEEAIYITCNMFSVFGSYQKSLLWIIEKSNFYAGKTPVWKVHDYIAKANAGIYNLHMPAMVRNPTGIPNNVGTYLVAYGGLTDGAKKEYMQIVEIKNPLTQPKFRVVFVKIGDIDNTGSSFSIPLAPQAGTNKRIAAGDRRTYDAVWANNALWMVTSVKRPTTGAGAAYWIKFSADGFTWPLTTLDHGPIDGTTVVGKGAYTSYPSIDVNSKGVVAFGFPASSPSMYGSAYATIRDDTIDANGTVRTADLVKAGLGPYYIHKSGTENRWGDYTGISMDPTNEDCFWTFNEYAGNKTFYPNDGQFGEWKTAWARLCYASPTAQPSKAPTLTPTMAPTVTMEPSTTMKPTLAPTFTKAPTLTPTMAPTIACFDATTPCVYNATSTKNVCCDAQKLVCRKAKAGQPFTCLKCLPSGKPCKKATAYQCCSKKCNLATRTCRK